MRKILFMPLFQMPSGHHQAADALITALEESHSNIECTKIEFLSYWNKPIEQLVSSFYLKWVDLLPNQYETFYRQYMYPSNHTAHSTEKKHYRLFERKLIKLVEEEKPDFIVCTHSFPSRLLSNLKQKGMLDIPIANVYTDFFVSAMWGKKGIDVHLVPDLEAKSYLINHCGVLETSIYVTGIPVHKVFHERKVPKVQEEKVILVAGGSSGLGNVKSMLSPLREESTYHYIVLCGNNRRLYEELSSWANPKIKAFPYISDRKKMNELYDKADAIVTKAGGITLSEAFIKRLPVFVHSALPGQEQINVERLCEKGLIMPINHSVMLEKQVMKTLQDEVERNRISKRIEQYLDTIEQSAVETLTNLKAEDILLSRP